MKNKKLIRVLCALLSVLMMVGMIPMLAVAVSAATDANGDYIPNETYVSALYATPEAYVEAMGAPYYEDDTYALYCDAAMGIVAYVNKKTGEILFTNPWDLSKQTGSSAEVRNELMSQIILEYSGGKGGKLNSYKDAAQRKQIVVKSIKNGVRVEYAIGENSARTLVPQIIERTAFDTKIGSKIKEAYENKLINKKDHDTFFAYFNDYFYTDPNLPESRREGIALKFKVTKTKNIDIYVLDDKTSKKQEKWIENMIKTYCPEYTFEEMDNDHDYVEYIAEAVSPAVFKTALEYVLDGNGLCVTLSGNGFRYDENTYRVKEFQFLPYMGASYTLNDGYSFLPDGSGVLYELDSVTTTFACVYGDDYALQNNLYGYHKEPMRMPVFGQVEISYRSKADGTWISKNEYNALTTEQKDLYTAESRGFFAVIEQGESLAKLQNNHRANIKFASVYPVFTSKSSDEVKPNVNAYAKRRYLEDYSVRYTMLSDDTRALEGGLNSWYECSWMGMAYAYRDYLDAKSEGFNRLTGDSSSSIPLYIETFGCMDTLEKVLSMPVTVSKPLATFDDIAAMYDDLAGFGITNVNFKLTGYANGGLYAEVPYKLKWESAVGGKSGFKELLEKAQTAGFGLYPDFDFVYTSESDAYGSVNLKKHASRTVDNRYTSKRMYSATYQTLVSHYQMVISPAVYSRFYEKLEKRYAKYGATGISLSTFGNSLNSDFNEENLVLREDAKEYVVEGLAYFKNKNYDIMVDGGNAYTWDYATHILNISLDSSRFVAEKSAVPFVGVVLHGYKEFAGSAVNMEGNLSYAMLKAMECGSAAYFVLSYRNYEHLKEDELLSQNYSVRYNLWKDRLVEIYNELNYVLADVQYKLIINWEQLDATRVADQDELLKDIADAAEEAKQAIADKLENDRLASLEALSQARANVSNAADVIDGFRTNIVVPGLRDNMLANLGFNAENALASVWKTANKDNLSSALNSYVITPYANIQNSMKAAKETIVNAKVGYDLMKANNVNEQLMKDALASLENALDKYVMLLNAYSSVTYTLTTDNRDAYINGTDATLEGLEALMEKDESTKVTIADEMLYSYLFGEDKLELHDYEKIGVEELYNAILRQLELDGYLDAQNADKYINVQALYNFALAGKTEEPPVEDDAEDDAEEDEDATEGDEGAEGGEGEEEKDPEAVEVVPDPPKSKYAVDNNVIAVTYGEKGTPYKTILLNFNDYAIQTSYQLDENSPVVTYTIPAYGYIVLMH